ncbi:hypothetical protein CEUSTIGMA_g4497.t1 [Chlamydomonas eustigma]|uniref:EF-hand domain-containing protein n=1 Tax=Chlamydomonas eustigma TaxID=1157962 RepID=A0A250X1U9_9CHLO|nr:hypothetical protein CEUSTIGMA_g4497.t1 [Chlamydomonas eustigma]|eukprot:GAX77051.1 hypothetical protein CEUSTIGMA_g4497.t1 [Chlamydomonas eustigma]
MTASSDMKNPFTHSRLRGYAGKLDSSIDISSAVANDMALASTNGSGLFHLAPNHLPPLSSMSSTLNSPQRFRSPPKQQQGHANAAALQAALNGALHPTIVDEITAMKAEISGMEAVLGYIKASGEGGVSAAGKKLNTPATQQQLKSRAAQYIKAVHDAPLLRHQQGVSRTEGGADFRKGAPHHVLSRDAHYSSNTDFSMQSSQFGFDQVMKALKGNRTWQASIAPQPAGRGEAVVLEAALDESLPAGAIMAKYHPDAPASAVPTGSTGKAFIGSQDVGRDFEALEAVQREAARQVASHCVEQGKLLLKVSDRYREFYAVLGATVQSLVQTAQGLADRLEAASIHSEQQEELIASLRRQLSSSQGEAGAERDRRIRAETQLEHVTQDSEVEINRLRGENQLLSAKVELYAERLDELNTEQAVDIATANLRKQMEALEDERDGLAQRIRFMERKLLILREEARKRAPTFDLDIQTDPVQFVSDEVDADDGGDGADNVPESMLPDLTLKPRKKLTTLRVLGGFSGMFSPDAPTQGRIRGARWTSSSIAQIYMDKIVADSVSDRDGNPRSGLCEFAYLWHITRYGLRNLAESSLLDLIASVRHHARRLQRVRWFGRMTALFEANTSGATATAATAAAAAAPSMSKHGYKHSAAAAVALQGSNEPVDTPSHLAMYLFALQQLSYPSTVAGLFATESNSDDTPVLVKQQAVHDASRAVFRYLNDPEAAATFLTRSVDTLPVMSIDGGLRADSLVRLFMAEYQKRLERNILHLSALFRAGDCNRDGFIVFEEFVMLIRHIDRELPDRMVSKMYSEAVRLLPPGQYSIPVDVFIKVMHSFGFDRWRIDVSTVIVNGVDLIASLPFKNDLARNMSLWPRPDISQQNAINAGTGSIASSPYPMSAAPSLTSTLGVGWSSGFGIAADAMAVGGADLSTSQVLMKQQSSVSSSPVKVTGGDKMLRRLLDSALVALEPSLEDIMEMARDRLTTSPQLLAADPGLPFRLEEMYHHMEICRGTSKAGTGNLNASAAAAAAAVSTSDAPAAWLAFRLLYDTLTTLLGKKPGSNSPSRGGLASPSRRISGANGGVYVAGSAAWRAGIVGSPPTTSGMSGAGGPPLLQLRTNSRGGLQSPSARGGRPASGSLNIGPSLMPRTSSMLGRDMSPPGGSQRVNHGSRNSPNAIPAGAAAAAASQRPGGAMQLPPLNSPFTLYQQPGGGSRTSSPQQGARAAASEATAAASPKWERPQAAEFAAAAAAGTVPLPIMFGNSEVFSLPSVTEESSMIAPVGSFLQEEEAGPAVEGSNGQVTQEEVSVVVAPGDGLMMATSGSSGFRFPSMTVREALEAGDIMKPKPSFKELF